MPNPVPNWYPDPSNPAAQRWWDGLQWTAHTRAILMAPPVAPAHATPYVPFAPQPQYAPVDYSPKKQMGGSTFLLRRNTIGFIGVALGLGAFIIDFLGLVGIAGIVLCIIGLVRDEQMRRAGVAPAKTGRGWLIAGIVLGVIASIVFLSNLARVAGQLFNL